VQPGACQIAVAVAGLCERLDSFLAALLAMTYPRKGDIATRHQALAD
jgi:hypothetical protein